MQMGGPPKSVALHYIQKIRGDHVSDVVESAQSQSEFDAKKYVGAWSA